MLVATSLGLLELHAIAPAAEYQQRVADFNRFVSSLRFRKPPDFPDKRVANSIRDAAKILGTWKAFRSRITLTADGSVVIKPDDFQTAVAEAADRADPQSAWLRGSFRASGDLLFITWEDKSRLNFRWRLRDEELLLTDHEGQISQLRRILE